jgi:hypothetical protein
MMKKYIYLLLSSLSFGIVQSQDITDAMRYAQDNLTGTARFRAMSGAFGALGGDLSSINVNPAGSAVFSNNQITLTLSDFSTKNNSNYFETKTSTSDSSFDLNQAGGVFVFKNQYPSSDWKKISFAINYENINNFDNSIFSAGINEMNSIDGYFLSYANYANGGNPVPQEFVNTVSGESISDLYSYLGNNFPNMQYPNLSGFGAQQAMMGYQGYIINAVDDTNNNSLYTSNNTLGGNYYQENNIYSKGYNGKLSFNMASSYKDKWYFGINLNSHFIDLTRTTNFYESNTNPLNNNYTFRRVSFDNNLYTHGTGFSFQIGAIAKITSEVRFGLAYESPTWLHLTEEFSQKLVAVSKNNLGELLPDYVNPNVTNYYEPYKLQTPGKLTGSFAYVFGKTGLLSIDYAIKDYGSTKFKPESDEYFRGLNNEMSNTLASTSEVRIGGEYKIKALSLRGGYRFEQSPYKNSKTIGDLNSYSGGLGYNFGEWRFDLAYTYGERNSQQSFFNQGLTDAAKINTKNNNVTITLAFEL